MSLNVDASNACIPATSSLKIQTPPLPKTERGMPLSVHGSGGRLNSDRPLIVYPSGRLVVIRELAPDSKEKTFVYRGHTANVNVAKFSPSGCYVASGDDRGKLRIWSYDNSDHLCKLDLSHCLAGPIRDLSWDVESKRLVVVGQGSPSDPSSVCAKVIQWDTGVKIGDLGQHSRNKASSCSFKPHRPMRIVTGGSDDFKCVMNKGPPFARVPPTDNVPAEKVHIKGSIHCVRYNNAGDMLASVGTDKAVAFYDGKTMELKKMMDKVHSGSIYSCAWDETGEHLLTCSADGTAKLISATDFDVVKTWNVAEYLLKGVASKRVPLGGMVMGCAFVHDNVPVVVAMNGRICTLSKTDESVTECLTGHQFPISGLAMDYETDSMYTCDTSGVVVRWNASTLNAIENIQRSDDGGNLEGFDATAMNKVHSGAMTGLIHLGESILSIGWDDQLRISSSNTMKNKLKLEAQPNAICRGKNLAVIMTVNGIQIVKNDKIVSSLISLPYEALSICISSDDSTVYVGGRDSNIYVYQVNGSDEDVTLDNIHTINGGKVRAIYSLALSNDGTKLASADSRDVCVWNVLDGYSAIIGGGTWCFHQQPIGALAWSNDDSVLASGSNDDSIYFWSLQKKTTRIHYSHSHRGGVTSMEFLKNKDGFVLVSVGHDACVNQWDVTDDVMKKFG